jgi:outer membrane protein TolC
MAVAGVSGLAGYLISQSHSARDERLRAAEEKLEKLTAALETEKKKAAPQSGTPVDTTEFIRLKLLLHPAQKAVESAEAFLKLTQAREAAGQVTKLDVSNAEGEVQNHKLVLMDIQRKLASVTQKLSDETGADPEQTIPVQPFDFGGKLAGKVQEMRVDAAAGTISLLTRPLAKDGKTGDPEAAQMLFNARRIDERTALAEAEKTQGPVSESTRREIKEHVRELAALEVESLLTAQRIESTKKAAEASELSFERGLQSSFDVVHAEEQLLKAKMDFINRIVDYRQQLFVLEGMIGRRVDSKSMELFGPKEKDTAVAKKTESF